MKRQPRALYLINFISMWEYFSYYGMRVLLILFMTKVLRYNDSAAFSLYALYTTLIELGAVVGGIAADRLLGLKRSIKLGGWIIFFGHICLALPGSEKAFFLGLGSIVVGTSLFRSNAAVLLGQFYEENDPRRDAGYTLYYTGINIGGFLATVFCGIVAEVYGWHAGFSLAALGMLSGNIALSMGRKLLAGKGESYALRKNRVWQVVGISLACPVAALTIYYYETVTPIIPLIVFAGIYYVWRQTKNCPQLKTGALVRLAVYAVFLIIFFGCEEQLGSSLILFAERHVERTTWFGVIPAASLIMINPLTILITGPFVSRFLQKAPWQGISKIGMSFCLLGLAFGVLFIGCANANAEQDVSLMYVIGSFTMIALGELFIGPTVFAYASEIAPRHLQGLIMGMVTMGFSLANLLSGIINQTMVAGDETSALEVYSGSFEMIGISALGLGCALIFFNKKIKIFAS